MPPAPARFSTTTGWPSDSAMRWPTPRASTSGTPPAVVGTRTRMGFDGKSLWPKAFRARKSKTAANPFTSFALRSVGGRRWGARERGDLAAQRRAHFDLHRVQRGLELLQAARADDRR